MRRGERGQRLVSRSILAAEKSCASHQGPVGLVDAGVAECSRPYCHWTSDAMQHLAERGYGSW
jgi:hypothetical protein